MKWFGELFQSAPIAHNHPDLASWASGLFLLSDPCERAKGTGTPLTAEGDNDNIRLIHLSPLPYLNTNKIS
jgi:hypothetical protein